MSQPLPSTQDTLPKPLKTARIILWIQTAATGVLLFLQLVELAGIQEHGEEISAIGRFELIENPIVLLIGFIAAASVTSRRPWSRPLAIVVEALAIMSGSST